MSYSFHKNNEDDIKNITDRINDKLKIILDLQNYIDQLEILKKQSYTDMIRNSGSSMLISMSINYGIYHQISHLLDMIMCEQKQLEKEKYYLNNAMNSIKKRKYSEIEINKPENSDM